MYHTRTELCYVTTQRQSFKKVHCSHTTFAIHFYMTEVHTHRISFTIVLRIWRVSSLLDLVLQKLSLVHRLLLAGVLLGDTGPWYAERQW